MKHLFILLLMLAGCCNPAMADHITGGELFYTLVGTQGNTYQYNVVIKMYMRCNSGRQFNNPAVVSIFDKGNNGRVRDIEVPLTRSVTINRNESDRCITNPPEVCYQVGFYEFTVSLPASASGYIVASQFVFRIAGIRNLTPFYSNVGTTYMGEIPGTEVESGPRNNSAHFIGSDLVVVCANNSFSYSFAAEDQDGDQLRYRFCTAFQGGSFRMGMGMPATPPPFQPVPYGNGFTGTMPLGDKVRINEQTGLITGIAPDAGVYVVTVCVDEIRNGKVIATQRKDLQIYIASCTIAAASIQPEYNLCRDVSELAVTNMSSSPLIQTYNWELANGSGGLLASSTGEELTHQFADTGLYYLKLVINRGGECADSSVSLVRVYPGFFPAFDFEGVCGGRPTRFTDATRTRYGSISSWEWNFGDETNIGQTADVPDPEYRYTTLGLKRVALRVTNTNGCIDTVSREVTIMDKPLLELPFRDTTICINDPVQLRAKGSGVLQWSPLLHMSNPEAEEPVVQPPVSTTYVVQLDDEGCTTRDSVQVKVVRSVTLDALEDTTICAGDTILLRVRSDALRYRWAPADGLLDSEAATPRVVTAASATYRLVASTGSCTATADVRINTVPYPRCDAGPDTTICYGTEAFLNGVHDGSRFSWNNTSSLASAASLQTPARPLQTTAYVLESFSSQGCPKAGKDTVLVTVRPPVAASAGRDTTAVLGQPLQLQASGGTEYQWSPATNLSAADIANPVAIFRESYGGSLRYTVRVATPEGCFDTASLSIRVFATGPNVFVPTAFSPNNDGLNDLLRPIAAGMQRVNQFLVFNRWGQLLYTDRNGRGWDGMVNGQPQQTGVYVWMVDATDFSGRKIVQKGTVTLLR